MLEYYKNMLCVPSRELIENGSMTWERYKKLAARGRIDVVRRGGGAKGRVALVAVDSLPTSDRAEVERNNPGGAKARLKEWILSNYEIDQNAVAFFHDRGQTGLDLTEEKVAEYVTNASVLNTCIRLYRRAKESKPMMGEKYNWAMMANVIETLREKFGHNLPASTLRFRKKVNEYMECGYGCLISGKFGNQNTRKVDFRTERLVVSLSAMPNKPFNTDVHEMYEMFVTGELDVADLETGELFDAADFADKNGEPRSLSASTIANILNKPENRLLVAHAQMSFSTFLHEEMPHVHRHGGDFSLSQVTMDDVDLSRKLADTKKRVHAYYAYDVVSQCVIGAAYARKKDDGLVVDCFRDMFRFIERRGWGMPAVIEVENHLMSQYKEGFLKAGAVFKFVHFCAPLNSQEKYAEQLNGGKKRSVIHRNHEGIGRFYGKGKWRMESKKVSDAENDTWEDGAYYSFEQLVAEDRRDNAEWNNRLHPDQKRFPGMTRMQVLEGRINPTLRPLDKLSLSRYIGVRVETSIRRNSTVRVAEEDWWLSDPSVLGRLEPNNYRVTACYLPDEDGRPTEVYLMQGDRYIDRVERVETFSRVIAEQTDEDVARFVEQRKKIAKFGRYVRERSVGRVAVVKKETMPPIGDEAEAPAVVETPPPMADEPTEWRSEFGFRADALADM